jgi:asparagine synthase (glutamine-hydrolysing)
MCGIAGFVIRGQRDAGVWKEALFRMTRALAHRGPDGEGMLFLETEGLFTGLGHRRLAILDLSERANQPMANEDKTLHVVFNGEIYNHPELKPGYEAKGHFYSTTSDTETILHAHEEEGPLSVRRLDGMFAHALWDAPKKQLTLVRDRMGIKPLFYALVPGGIVFASEIKALLEAPGVAREMDMEALDAYITLGYIPGERTIYRGIRKLPPASVLVFEDGKARIERYWELRYVPKRDSGVAALTEELRDVFAQAAKRHLLSDVPVGAFLSGGLDSAVVAAVTAPMEGGPADAFSLGHTGGGPDEIAYAGETARHIGMRHHGLRLAPDVAQVLPGLVWHLDEPFFDNSILPTYRISAWAGEHVKVALSGDGGDELFAGYEWCRRQQWAQCYQALPETLRGGAERLLPDRNLEEHYGSARRHKAARLLRDLNSGVEAGFIRRTSVAAEFRARLYSPALREHLGGRDAADTRRRLFWVETPDPREKMLFADTVTFLPDDCLFKVDRMSMACGLEVRVPFLDRELVEFAARLPFHYKLRGFTSKWILRRAFRPLLPASLFRRPKTGFTIPVSHWLRGELGGLARRMLLEETFPKRDLFDPGFVRWMLDAHQAGTQELGHRIWSLVVFEVWARLFLDQSTREKPLATLWDMAG